MSVSLTNVSYFKDSGNPALFDINFSIGVGEFWGIVGLVGSGKTLLLEILAGIIAPHAGKVTTNTSLSSVILFENSEDIFSQKNVYEELALGPRHLGWSEKKIYVKSQEVLEQVSMDSSFLDRVPFSLSDGEKRRLALALLLIIEPKLLFLDEPLSGLDLKNKKIFLKLLKTIQEEKKVTIVIASRFIKDIIFYIQNILFLENGKASFLGNTKESFDNQSFMNCFGENLPISIRFYNELFNLGFFEERLSFFSEETLISFIALILKEKNRLKKK